MTLYLRTVNKDRKSYGGFRWPSKIGSTIEAPDWKPTKACGNGLHGLPWGQGDMSLLDLGADSIFQVVEYDDDDAIDLGGKHKFPKCKLVFEGDRHCAAAFIAAQAPRDLAIPFLTATVGDYGTATAGYRGTATAGYRGTATAGDYGTATAGKYGTATAGKFGILQIRRDAETGRYRIETAYVGENGIEAGKPYKLNDTGDFVPA